MRNLYDQYSQPENRVTHALVSTLNQDRGLIRPFLAWCGAEDIPRGSDIHIVEQQGPGSLVSWEDDERRGLPDASFYTRDGWAFLVEAKVQATPEPGQLRRHLTTAERYGFESPQVMLLSVAPTGRRLPDRAVQRTWADLYAWFGRPKRRQSFWVQTLLEYMQVFEAKMTAQGYNIEGKFTVFDGIPFDSDNPYNYPQAKRLIRMLGDELRQVGRLVHRGVDPDGAGRAAITGSGEDRVWDILPLKGWDSDDSHTRYPHVTLELHASSVGIAVSIPNQSYRGFKSGLTSVGTYGFADLLTRIEAGTAPITDEIPGGLTMIHLVQRHYRSQRSMPTRDGLMWADLRVLRQDGAGGVKYQPEWIDSFYNLAVSKRSNMHVQVKTMLPLGHEAVQSKAVVGKLADALLAQWPMLELAGRE